MSREKSFWLRKDQKIWISLYFPSFNDVSWDHWTWIRNFIELSNLVERFPIIGNNQAFYLACERCSLTCLILNYCSSVCFSSALFSCLVLPCLAIINIYLWATLKSWRGLSRYLVSFVTEEQLFNIELKGNFLRFRNWFKNLAKTPS